ncbi:hypothetical protein C1I92_07775 [Jiangella anatolica]|uniref:Uncharacterized protein n=1 Tax=Jiangella anatolica TaxID=2670374 RepID=A0A2W2CX31_9ACTN|nr:hypothetical protein C1I92_07775 [Jiangella anatolica]
MRSSSDRQLTRPAVSAPGGSSPTIDIALIVLPLPDSPMRPVVRPASTAKDTLSITVPVVAPDGSTTTRSSTRSSGAPGVRVASPAAGAAAVDEY